MQTIDFRFRFRTAACLPEYIPRVKPEFENWLDLYKIRDRISEIPVEQQFEMMTDAGVEKAVTCSTSHNTNRVIYDISKKLSGRICLFATANSLQGIKKAYYELEKAFDEYGAYGLALGPYSTGLPMDDRRNYPLYAITERRGKILNLHSSIHFNRTLPFELGNPKQLDQIAIDFPELKIIMSHAGNGFGDTPISIAMRHPTIYLEYSALHPSVISPEMKKAMNGMFRNRILWGSEYPLFNFDCWKNWETVVDPEIMPKFAYENAKHLLESVPE